MHMESELQMRKQHKINLNCKAGGDPKDKSINPALQQTLCFFSNDIYFNFIKDSGPSLFDQHDIISIFRILDFYQLEFRIPVLLGSPSQKLVYHFARRLI